MKHTNNTTTPLQPSTNTEGHTPEQWKVSRIGEAWKVKEWACIANIQYAGGDSDFVILANYPTNTLMHVDAEKNAKLIASAPQLKAENEALKEQNKELLEALKDLYTLAHGWADGVNYPSLIHVKTIISKHSK